MDSNQLGVAQEILPLNEKQELEDDIVETNDALEEDRADANQLELDEGSTKCGFGGYYPKWLQKFASKKSYVFVYGLLGLYETAIGTYYVGTISTIEKRFRFPSTVSGMMTSAWDVGTLVASLLVAYYGHTGHRTRWVAVAIMVAAISCLLRYTPHLIYGPGDVALVESSDSPSSMEPICNSSHQLAERCAFNSEGTVAFTILIISLFLFGIGTSPFYSLGAAYLDDNVRKNKFPFLFSLVVCVRFLGPTLGFLLSSYTLSFYIDPYKNPSFGEDDPRWVGAWYLGWNPLGLFGVVIASLMALFPKILPREAERKRKASNLVADQSNTRSFQNFKATLIRLSKNKVFMFNSFSSTIGMLAIIGYWIFMPKYIETQFRKTASEANLITGTIGLVSTAVGVVSSGALISRFKPRPRYLAAWNVFTETIDILAYLSFAYLGCYKDDLHGEYAADKSWNLIAECNAGCNCGMSLTYSPVCSSDRSTTFYSPCHAGCTSWYRANDTKVYENCSCVDDGFGTATEGACPVVCQTDFTIFLIVLCLMEFLSSTGRAGNTIIQYRAVSPEDKSTSIAITSAIFCTFAFIPGPPIHGMLLDLSCTVWGMTCGKTGNCWLYDGQKMRYLINFTAAGLLLIATALDVGVLVNVGELKIYDEECDKAEEKHEKQPFLVKLKKMNKLMINSV